VWITGRRGKHRTLLWATNYTVRVMRASSDPGLGEERLGYLSPRSGKAVEFNQVSVSFCFRIDGTFFLRKQGQHFAQQSRPTMIKRKMRKKNVKPERA